MKKSAVFFVVFLVLLISGGLAFRYYAGRLITATVEIEFFPGVDKDLEKRVIRAAEAGEYRELRRSPHFLDRYLAKYYPKIIITERFLAEKSMPLQALTFSSFYCAVDLTSDLVRVTEEDEKKLFIRFSEQSAGGVSFLPFDQLNLYKRILINSETAKPLVFYRSVVCSVENAPSDVRSRLLSLLDFKPSYPEEPLMAGFAGDFVIEEFVKYSLKKNGFDESLKDVNTILKTPDIMSVNLEFVVSHRGKREEKKRFAFRASEKEFALITDSPIDLVSCANNHAADYGKISMLDTRDFLDAYGILHSGTGKDRAEAFAPAVVDRAGNKLSFYSICDTPVESRGFSMKDLKAGDTKPGAAYYDLAYLTELMSSMPDRLAIIQFHTGTEYAFTPSAATVKKARSLIDAGAEAVICHHPHVINGVEIYKGKLIAYSLGDFLLDVQKPNADESIIIFLFIRNNTIKSWAFYPTVCHYGSVKLTPERILDVEKRFLKLTVENF